MFKVRFHLGRGPYYKYWQIRDLKDKDAGPKYVNPETSQLVLVDCELVCNETKARKVYSRGVKDVCGWIKCEYVHWHDLHLSSHINVDGYSHLSFNPIINPSWGMQGLDYPINGLKIDRLVTYGNKVYTRYNSVAIENILNLQHAPC